MPEATTGHNSTSSDMSKVALVVSLLAMVLLVIFFFGMNRNIAGLTTEVQSLGALREDISSLDQRMVQFQNEMPGQVRDMLALDMVNEMAMKAAYLGNNLQDEAQREKMRQALDTLKEVRLMLESK